jgi:flavin-dependent dehydrogenase
MSESPKNSYDVLIAGGGPAGAAAAAILAMHGVNVAVLERKTFPRYHIGESLVPQTYDVLKRIGMLDAMKASDFPKKHSVRFITASGMETNPFYFSETIPGEKAVTWQVERNRFDQMMLDNARAKGAAVFENLGADAVRFDGDRAVGVMIENGDGPKCIQADVVIDATGRSRLIGKQLGIVGPVPGLGKGALWAIFKGAYRAPGIDEGETGIFRTADGGWFWYIPLPDDRVSIGWVGESDVLFGQRKSTEAFLDACQACEAVRKRIENATIETQIRGLREAAYRCNRMAGDGFVLIGDAYEFLDPVYSSGLVLGLLTGELAADTIIGALKDGDLSGERLGEFEPALREGVENIRCLINAFYDPNFSFKAFGMQFPEHRPSLIDCLIGDLLKDMSGFRAALATLSRPMDPLPAPVA